MSDSLSSAPTPLAETQIGPHLQMPAPRFMFRTTFGPRSLDDFRGRWLVFFSHPADFTPVCTSEFLAFARLHSQFSAIGCDLLGLSVDSLFSHLGWVRAIEQEFGVAIPFPVAEDPSMAVARAYGMLPAGAADSTTVRACFIIDPDGIIRMTSTYPMSVGRSVAEILRTVKALQTSDANAVFTPEGWQDGDPVIEATPALSGEGTIEPDWFYRTRHLEAGQ